MQTLNSIKAIVANVTFRNWTFHIGCKNDVPYLQVQFMEPDFYTGVPAVQKCRKWQLSYFMVDSEIVRTAFKAIMTALEHEAQEQFRYKDVQIYHPHFDLDKLVEFAKKKQVSVRT